MTRSGSDLESCVMDALVALCASPLPIVRENPLTADLVAVPLADLRGAVHAHPARMVTVLHEILERLIAESPGAGLEAHAARLSYWKNSATLASLTGDAA